MKYPEPGILQSRNYWSVIAVLQSHLLLELGWAELVAVICVFLMLFLLVHFPHCMGMIYLNSFLTS